MEARAWLSRNDGVTRTLGEMPADLSLRLVELSTFTAPVPGRCLRSRFGEECVRPCTTTKCARTLATWLWLCLQNQRRERRSSSSKGGRQGGLGLTQLPIKDKSGFMSGLTDRSTALRAQLEGTPQNNAVNQTNGPWQGWARS